MCIFLLFFLCGGLSSSSAFISVSCPPCHRKSACLLQDQRSSGESFKDEAERLLAQARALRADLPPEPEKNAATAATINPPTPALSPWTVPPDQEGCTGVGYRLDIDIGRESGTWMDPRWGASGKRIEFTLDVRFATATIDKKTSALAGEEIKQLMVKDNFGGKSSPVYILQTAESARLRNGFEKMKCYGGGYRIDTDAKNAVARFYVMVEGTPAENSSFGDVSIPAGCLYFSIPVFGGSISQLSSKEALITVRQVGWHTGWRREESRIVGTFRAKPMQDAKRRDKF
jgi:hypothetical protein